MLPAVNYDIKYFCVLFQTAFLLTISTLAQNKNDKHINWPEPVFEHITIADGLPENSVRCMLQDHLGYMWFGTQNGLVRYDGYEMKVYQPDPDDSLSISDRQIYSIYEDKSKTLWVGTPNGGLNRFDQETETFKSYLNNPNDSTTINSDLVFCIYDDNFDHLLVGTIEGLNLFDKKTEKFKHIYYQGQVYSPGVYEYISSLISRGKRISSILQVGNNEDLTKSFTINKKTIVLTVIMDEAGFDDGWLEDTRGNIVAGANNNNLVYAGGHTNSLIQVEIDTLNKGSYRLRYVSDGGWSYYSWRDTPPDYPDFWGVQVIELPEDQGNVREILNNIKTSALNYNVYALMEDRLTGSLYLGSSCGIFVFDGKNHSLLANNRFSELGEIHSFSQSNDGTLWIGHSMGLSKLNPFDNSLKLYQPSPSITFSPENNFGQIIEDYNGFIWGSIAGRGNGLICFDPANGRFKTYKNIPEKQESLSSNNVRSVYRDRSGILWVGTAWAGLNKWDSRKQKFKLFTHDPADPNRNNFNTVYSISEDSAGVIWFTTDDWLYSFNRNSNKFKNYKFDPKNNGTNGLYIENANTIWFGADARGLGNFNPSNGTFKFYSNDPEDSTTISSNTVSSILADGKDILWLGTAVGLNKFDKSTGKFTRFVHNPRNKTSISSNTVFQIFKDRNGVMWVGTNLGGLNKFNSSDGTFKSYHFTKGVGVTTLLPIFEDLNRNFWIGTYHSGLHLFDRDKEISVYNLTEKDGLANNLVTSILEDDSGNLWIGTENGLSKFNPKNREIKNYYNPGGFESNGYSSSSAFKTSSGEMLFGTNDGFIIFHPDSIKDDPVPPQVVINNVSLFNEPDKKLKFNGFISELKELDLSYNENDLRFDYVGLHYSDPSKNEYKYMLENFDEDWIDAGTQRNAVYTNLDAGEYVFRVTASNRDGVWNEQGASLKIIIPPPFWATWWAYSFYVLFVLGLLYSIRKYELGRTHLKNQHKLDEIKLKEREETDKMKSRFFANISHEFRTPLTLIKGPAEKINRNSSGDEIEKQTGVIKRNADRLLGLINQLLDLSKLEAGKLELKASKQNIVPFIKGLTMSFESVAERSDITLKVKAEKDKIELYFDKEKMTKIITNLLSNAFKFTPEGGEIIVTVGNAEFISTSSSLEKNPIPMKSGRNDNSIYISVKDTGIGISKEELPRLFDRFFQVDSSQTREHEGTGIGLALTKELVELHQGTISVDSKLNEGTEFITELPVGRSHLKDEEIVQTEEPVKNVIVVDKQEFIPTSVGEDNEVLVTDEDKKIVLVVEDNIDVREFIKDSLGSEFQIEEAANGEQGVRKAEQIIPDLIISDIMMPKMDGNELTRTLKHDEKTSHIPIILLTAKSGQQSKLEGLETGADDYLTKPFDTKELQTRINNLINIRRKLQQRFSSLDYVPVKSKKETEKKLTNLEEQFMCKVIEVIENHLSEEEFSIEQFGKEVGMSRVQLHRKLKALSGKSASTYLRSVRLSKAKQMIEEQKGNISEIAYSVGFSSPQYFTRCFKEEFGFPPSDLNT